LWHLSGDRAGLTYVDGDGSRRCVHDLLLRALGPRQPACLEGPIGLEGLPLGLDAQLLARGTLLAAPVDCTGLQEGVVRVEHDGRLDLGERIGAGSNSTDDYTHYCCAVAREHTGDLALCCKGGPGILTEGLLAKQPTALRFCGAKGSERWHELVLCPYGTNCRRGEDDCTVCNHGAACD
jgi:hypothetical protein